MRRGLSSKVFFFLPIPSSGTSNAEVGWGVICSSVLLDASRGGSCVWIGRVRRHPSHFLEGATKLRVLSITTFTARLPR